MESRVVYEKWKQVHSLQDTKQYATEEQLQADCFQWAWNTYPHHRRMLFHVQQKAKNKIEGARFKAIGVVRGPADLQLLIMGGITVYIELKLPGRTQSEEQIDFETKAKARGHVYVILTSFVSFKAFLKELL